jgi:hypothetical protein
MARQIILLKRGGCQGCFRIEESGKLRNQGFSLDAGLISVKRSTMINYTFSSMSCNLASVCRSSSEGFAGIFGTAANCEYVWNRVSVYFYS